jgi:DNA-binding NtrC family response regulator
MPPALANRPQTARFLLIDGDPAEAADFAAALELHFGLAAITVAANGRLAAEILRNRTVDVLVMDVMSLLDLSPVPEEAVSRLVKFAEGALAVALSNAVSVSATVEVMRAGAHDCIARPIAPEALSRQLAILARRYGKGHLLGTGTRSVELSAGPLSPARRPASRQPILPMWQQEQRIIEDAIASFSGNVALAAAALELSPSTIYRKRQAWAKMEGRKGAA